MTRAEKHIRHYNRLNGNSITRERLAAFHAELKKDIDSRRIDAHMPLGLECIEIEKRLRAGLEKMNGKYLSVDRLSVHIVDVDKILSTQKKLSGAPRMAPLAELGLGDCYGLEQIQSSPEGESLGDATNIYKMITDMIMQAMKKDGLIWRKPWKASASGSGAPGPDQRAQNYVTGSYYSGANYYLNWLPAQKGYASPYYFTMNQVNKLKGTVKKGASAWPVIYYKLMFVNQETKKSVTEDQAKKIIADRDLVPVFSKGNKVWGFKRGEDFIEVIRSFPVLLYYKVFNHEDTEGITIKVIAQPKPQTQKEKIESCERIVEQMPKRPPIGHGGDSAHYAPSSDKIQMPYMKDFSRDQEYYSTLFHEMVHSTGHTSRVGRDLTGAFGSRKYAFEELIAELGACYLCGESGVLYFTLDNSAAYVKSWQKRLQEEMSKDPQFFLRASAAAQKAADFVLDKGKEKPARKSSKERSAPVAKKKRVAQAAKPAAQRESKSSPPRPPVKRSPAADKVSKAAPEIKRSEPKPSTAMDGFTTADQAPAHIDTFNLPGPIGELLGDLQRYKLEIIVAGETHSSKSEIGKQIANAFAAIGDEVGYLDWEQGGMISRDTLESMARNIDPANKKRVHVSGSVRPTLEAVKALASRFKVVVLDSGTKLKLMTNAWVDELREEFPNTVWIVLMQQNEKGGTRGGSAAEFDAPVVIKTYRPDESDYKKNYAYLYKNRGNKTGLYYSIADKKIISDPTKKQV